MDPQPEENFDDAVGSWSTMMQLEIIALSLPVPESEPHMALGWLKSTAELLKSWMKKIEMEAARKNFDRYQLAEQLEVVEKSYGSVITRIRQEEEVLFDRQKPIEEETNQAEEETHTVPDGEAHTVPEEESHTVLEEGCHSPDSTVMRGQKVVYEGGIVPKQEPIRDAAVVPPKCFLCQNRHFLYHCQLFKQFSPHERLAYV